MASRTQSSESLEASDSLLASFPVGWGDEDPFGIREPVPDWTFGTWLAHLMGWILTAAAVSLGRAVLVQSPRPGGEVAGYGEAADGWSSGIELTLSHW